MSRTILNITLIHAFEILVGLLVVVKFFQIRKLYIKSSSKKKPSLHRRHSLRQAPVSNQGQAQAQVQAYAFRQSPAQKIFKEATLGFSRSNLPLPEVSFTEGLPLPEISYLPETDLSVTNEQVLSKNKAALNSYIDDMFFESSFEFSEDPKPFSLKKQTTKAHVEDEFITVAAENAQLVRELEMFNQRISFAR